MRETVNPDDFHAHRDEAMRKYWQGIEKIAFDYAVAEPAIGGGRRRDDPGRLRLG